MHPAQFAGLPGGIDLSVGVAVVVAVVVALALHLDARGRDTDHPLAFGVAALVGGLLGTVSAASTTRLAVGVGVPLLVGLLYLAVRDELEESAPPVVGSGDVDTGDMVLGQTVGADDVADDAADRGRNAVGGDGDDEGLDVGDAGDDAVGGDDGVQVGEDGEDAVGGDGEKPADAAGNPDGPSQTHPDPALGTDDGNDRDADR